MYIYKEYRLEVEHVGILIIVTNTISRIAHANLDNEFCLAYVSPYLEWHFSYYDMTHMSTLDDAT